MHKKRELPRLRRRTLTQIKLGWRAKYFRSARSFDHLGAIPFSGLRKVFLGVHWPHWLDAEQPSDRALVQKQPIIDAIRQPADLAHFSMSFEQAATHRQRPHGTSSLQATPTIAGA